MKKKHLGRMLGPKSRFIREEKVILYEVRRKLLLDTPFKKFTADWKQRGGSVIHGGDTMTAFVEWLNPSTLPGFRKEFVCTNCML